TGFVRWKALAPQHATVPPESSAQVRYSPAAIAVTPVRPETATGVVREVVVPSPSWPNTLSPQQRTVPAASSAHECAAPTVTAVAPLVSPGTSTGRCGVESVVPMPSWPEKLLPKHFTPPPVVTAHWWPAPLWPAIAVTPLASPGISIGVG